MDISRSLAAHLAVLTQALDEDIDLDVQLHALVVDLGTAVASYAGMTMTVVADGQEINLTAREDIGAAGEITATLRIPLHREPGSPAGSRLVLYATTPGAFVDLAADLCYLLALDPRVLALDADLGVPPESGVTGLAEHSAINQAIGVLIDQGHTPESARSALRHLAAIGNVDLAAAAARLLHAASGPASTAPEQRPEEA